MTFDPSFQNLNQALGTEYDADENQITTKLDKDKVLIEMETKMKDLSSKMKKSTYKNADFMRTEVASGLASAKVVLDMLEQTLKVGASPQYFEKYSFLLNSYINMMREYRQICRDEADVEIAERRLSIKEMEIAKNNGSITNNNLIVMDSKSLLELAMNASKQATLNSSMKEITTDFNIDVSETNR